MNKKIKIENWWIDNEIKNEIKVKSKYWYIDICVKVIKKMKWKNIKWKNNENICKKNETYVK